MKDLVIQSYYGFNSGVVEKLIGREKACYVFDYDDSLGILGCILTEVSQGSDLKVTQYSNDE